MADSLRLHKLPYENPGLGPPLVTVSGTFTNALDVPSQSYALQVWYTLDDGSDYEGVITQVFPLEARASDEFAAKVEELLPRVEEGVGAAKILSAINYKDDRNVVLAPVVWGNGPLNWEQKDLLLCEVMLRVPIWRSRVPHTWKIECFDTTSNESGTRIRTSRFILSTNGGA